MSAGEASAAMQHGQHAEMVANIEFSEDPTRIVPCDAVAIGGKLVQNNGIELCAPDRCSDTWDSRMNVFARMNVGLLRHLLYRPE